MEAYTQFKQHLNLLEKLTRASYSELFLSWVIINTGFALIYFALSLFLPEHGPLQEPSWTTIERFWNSLYFSAITASTTGYGDIVPHGFSKMLAAMQAVIAFLIFGVFLTKLVARRQDAMLHDVHRMTFEGIFYHIRHVLFIVRKDFDALIYTLEHHRKLTDHDWENLTVAYLQAQSLVEEIPDLYGNGETSVVLIDPKREQLLFESMHRTLQRIDRLLMIMRACKIDMHAHEPSMRQLRVFIESVDAITPVWREKSPYRQERAFEDMRELTAAVRSKIDS